MKSTGALVVLLVGLCVVFLAFIAWSATQLPEQVSTYFGLGGHADQLSSRSHALFLMGGLGLLLPLMPAAMSLALRFVPNDFINIPNREYWLAPERREATYRFFSRQLLWLSYLFVCFFVGMHWLTLQAHRDFSICPPSGAFVATVGVLLMALGVWWATFMCHFRLP
jgi:serine/threonine-protein kinase